MLQETQKGGFTAAFFTLGCRVNQYETRAMEEAFIAKGFLIKSFDEVCDVYVINTCTVTSESDRKCRNIIRRAAARANNAVIIVTGCYAQKNYDEIASIEGVSYIIGNEGKSTVAEKALDLIYEKTHSPVICVNDIFNVKQYEKMSISASDRTRAFIKIVDGCDNKCSYCIIPSVRGHVRSRNLDEIIAEANTLANAGYKEIVLTGIETAAYGTDFEQKRGDALLELIREISNIDNVERIRLGSLEPTLFKEEFTMMLASIPKVMPHFHLSLQSGCDKTLAAMRRKYNTITFKKTLWLIRSYFKDVLLTTDVIVGFPGESEADFNETVKFTADCNFSFMHIFPYSKRNDTDAAIMKRQISSNDKKRRATILYDAMIAQRRNILDGFVGKTMTVLTEVNEGDKAIGHTENFIETECIYLQQKMVEPNTMVKVKITGVTNDALRLIGQIIE